LVSKKRVLLQHDNALAHTARLTYKKLLELNGIEVFLHPAYSLNLAQSHYHLFRSMAHYLKGQQFKNVDEVE